MTLRFWMVLLAIALTLWGDLSIPVDATDAVRARDGVPRRRVGGGSR